MARNDPPYISQDIQRALNAAGPTPLTSANPVAGVTNLTGARRAEVADLAALRAVTTNVDNEYRRVTAEDFDFRYSDDETEADDGVNIIKPDNVVFPDPGRHLRDSKTALHNDGLGLNDGDFKHLTAAEKAVADTHPTATGNPHSVNAAEAGADALGSAAAAQAASDPLGSAAAAQAAAEAASDALGSAAAAQAASEPAGTTATHAGLPNPHGTNLNDLGDVNTAGSAGDVLTLQGGGGFALETPSAAAAGPDDWGTDPDICLTEGLGLSENDPIDLDIIAGRHHLWNKTLDSYFKNPQDAAVTLPAVGGLGGNHRVDIVEVPITDDGPPVISDGTPVSLGGGATLMTGAGSNADEGITVGYLFAIRLDDTGGIDRELNDLQYKTNAYGGSLQFHLYVAPDNGLAEPDAAPVWGSATYVADSGSYAGGIVSKTFTSIGETLPANDKLWVIFKVIQRTVGGSQFYMQQDIGAGNRTNLNACVKKKSTDGGVTWVYQGTYPTTNHEDCSFGDTGQTFTYVTAPAVPAFPAVSANHKKIGEIGDPTGVTITAATDGVTTDAPVGDHVQLFPDTDQYRP
jgi:hypothetical protein